MYKKKSREEIEERNEELAQEAAQLFIKAIKENNAPWQKGWDPAVDKCDYNMFTMKDDSNKVYKGYNALLTSLKRSSKLGTDDPRWMTFAELNKYNNNLDNPKEKVYVKKGEKQTLITFYSMLYKDKDGKPLDPAKMTRKELEERTVKQFPVLRPWFIFNASQTQRFVFDENGKPVKDEKGNPKTQPGFPFELTEEQIEKARKEFKPDYEIEKIISNTGVKILNDSNNECFYDSKRDEIHVPQKERFENAQEYFQTLAHELIHWTGDKRRLDRPEAEKYSKSKEMRAREELVAEIGCYLLCREAQFMYKPSDNNNAYIQDWCSFIEEKEDAIQEACKKAQKSVNYIMDFTVNKNKKTNMNDVEIVISNESIKGRGRS